jgi:hypothetical protein
VSNTGMAGRTSRENHDEQDSSVRRRPDWKTSLLAVLAGNTAYYSLMPHLPRALQNNSRFDLGLALDFVFCVIAYFIARAIFAE